MSRPVEVPPSRAEEASGWCVQLAEGPLGSNKQAEFDAWLAADPANIVTFERAVAMWQAIGDGANEPEMVEARTRALAHYQRVNRKRWAIDDQPRWRVFAGLVAAIILMVAASVTWVSSWPQEFRTGIGERRVVLLDDGSRLSMDAMTDVEVKLGAQRRALTLLAGRAKFDVAKDPMRPFTVTAGDKVVVATGTSFGVELIHNQMHVILYEGHVAVLDRQAGNAIGAPLRLSRSPVPADRELQPGKELVADLDTDVATVSPSDPSRSLAWEAGQLAFDDEPLASAVERVNRYSAQKIRIVGAATGNLHVDGVFDAGDPGAFVVGITETLPLRADERGNEIILSGKGKP